MKVCNSSTVCINLCLCLWTWLLENLLVFPSVTSSYICRLCLIILVARQQWDWLSGFRWHRKLMTVTLTRISSLHSLYDRVGKQILKANLWKKNFFSKRLREKFWFEKYLKSCISLFFLQKTFKIIQHCPKKEKEYNNKLICTIFLKYSMETQCTESQTSIFL